MPSCCYNPYSSCYRYPSLCRYYVSPTPSCCYSGACSYSYPCRLTSCRRSCCYPSSYCGAVCCSASSPCRATTCSTCYPLNCSYRYPCRKSACASRWCCDPLYAPASCCDRYCRSSCCYPSRYPAPVSCSPRFCSGRYPCEDDICAYYPVSAEPVRPATSYALSSPAKKRSMSVGRTSRDYLGASACRF